MQISRGETAYTQGKKNRGSPWDSWRRSAEAEVKEQFSWKSSTRWPRTESDGGVALMTFTLQEATGFMLWWSYLMKLIILWDRLIECTVWYPCGGSVPCICLNRPISRTRVINRETRQWLRAKLFERVFMGPVQATWWSPWSSPWFKYWLVCWDSVCVIYSVEEFTCRSIG